MGKVLSVGIITLVLLSLGLGNLGVGTDDGLASEKALPSTGWDVVTTGISWFSDAMTFHLEDAPVMIGTLMWLFIVVTIFIPLAYLIRGGG